MADNTTSEPPTSLQPPPASSGPPSSSTTTTFSPPLPYPFNYTNPAPTLITQGAEALLYKTYFLEPPPSPSSIQAALKIRPSKPYRHPTLDARLTKQRVLAEARVLVKLSGLGATDGEVKVPAVLGVEWDLGRRVKGLDPALRIGKGDGGGAQGSGGAWLLMEWIEGRSVKDLLREWDGVHRAMDEGWAAEEKQREGLEIKKLLRRIGKAVGAMHFKGGVVHGDLTSSNIMIRPRATKENGEAVVNGETGSGDVKDGRSFPTTEGEIVLIDFGLAVQSVQDEDRAVDLYVLERAFGSTHPRQEGWFDAEVLQHQEGYRGSFKGASVVLKRLEEVRLRGRKRSMIG